MSVTDYKEKRRNQLVRYFRMRLGVLQMVQKPLYSLLLLPVVFSIILLWCKQEQILLLFNVPSFLYGIYKFSIQILSVMLPILLAMAILEWLGNISAKKDEADLQEAFKPEELRNGFPILIDKKRVPKTDVMVRQFYTEISLPIWEARKEDIAHSMNVTFVEEFCYANKHSRRRIIMITRVGRNPSSRGVMYDEQF